MPNLDLRSVQVWQLLYFVIHLLGSMYTRISPRLSGNSKIFATCEIAFSHSINAMQRRQITDGSRKRKTLFLYFNAVIRIIMGAPRFTNPLPPACGPHLERLKPQLHIVSPYLTDPSTVWFRTYIFCILYVVLYIASALWTGKKLWPVKKYYLNTGSIYLHTDVKCDRFWGQTNKSLNQILYLYT